MTAAFAAVLVSIADLAWATAVGTTGPWFSPATSAQMYLATLFASALVVIGLAVVASIHVASIGRAVAQLDQRIAVLRGTVRTQGVATHAGPFEDPPEFGDGIDEAIGAMDRNIALGLAEMGRMATEAIVAIPKASSNEEVRAVVRELVSERIHLRKGVSHVRSAVAGPIGAAIVFGGIASMMLPATEGFGIFNFQLNTALILFLSYGWPFLLGWAAASIAISRHIEPL